MPKVVEVPDFGAIEFPDEMDDAQISSVLKQRFSPATEPTVSVQDLQKQAGVLAAQESAKDAEILAQSNPLGSSKGVDITGGMVFDYDQGKAVPDVPYLIRQNNQRIQSEVDALLTPYGAKFDNGNLVFNPDTRTKDYTPDEYAQALNRAKQITHDYVPEERVQEFANDSGLATAILGRFTGGLTSAAAGAVGIVSPDTARDMAGFAAQANQLAQDVPGVTGSVGRGIGNVATFAPLMTAGPGGIPGIIAAGGQAALQARSEAGFAREQEMRYRGATVEEVIQEEGQRAGRSAAVKSAIAIPAYLAAGRLAAGATGRVMEGASRGAQVAGQTLTATGANVATGAGIRAIEGEQAIPNLEQLTTDALFGIIHGVSVRPEARRAAVEESVRRGVSPEEIATEPTAENFGFKPEEAPKTYYHGTKADAPFDQFSTSRYFNSPTGRRVERTPITFDSHGQIYFTPDYKYASEYSAPGTEVISANLDIQRPLDFTSLGADSVTNKQFDDFLAANGVEYTSRGSDRPVFERLQQGDLKKPAMKAGFDGMKLRESKADQAEALIAFDNSQVKRVPTQSGEPNLGPGAANAREFAERPRVKIAAYNAAVDAQRVQRGLDPLMGEVRKSDPEKWAAAEDAIELDPGLPARVVEGINNGTKKSVSAEEQMAIQWRMIDLQNRKEMELERATDPTNTPAEQEVARSQYEALELELQATESANRKAGSSSSDALRIRQLIANSDFTYSGMLRRRELAKGSPLDSTERATIKKQAETIERTQRELDLKVEEKQFGEPIDESIRAIEAEAAKNPDFTPEVRSLADRIVSRLDKAASSALERLRSKFAQVNTGIDPTILSDMAIYGASKIAKGLLKFGQWSASMVKDFGEGVKPYLQDAWKSANDRLDQEIAITPTKQREQVGEAVKKTKVAATAESIGAQMKARIADGDKLTDLRGYVQRLMETVVRSGVKGRQDVTDAVHSVMREVDPNISRRQTMDMMSGYGDFKALDPDSIKAEVRDIRGQLQQIAKLEDLQSKQPLKKTGVERRTPSDEERRLIQEVNEAKKKFGVTVTDPATQLKSALQARKKYYANRISDLEAEIKSGQRRIKTKTESPTDAELDAMRVKVKQLKADQDALFGPREITDTQRLSIYKKALERRTADLEERLAKKEFGPRPKKPPIDLSKDPEAARLKADNERAKRDFEQGRIRDEFRRSSLAQKAWRFTKESLNLPRAILSSWDASAVLRQGGLISLGNPRRALTAIRDMFRGMSSQRKAEEMDAAIRLRKNAHMYEESGLYLAPLEEVRLSRQEEQIMSEFANKIPGIRVSNRAFITFLNRLRADSFDSLKASVEKNGVPFTKEEATAIANYINVATGRGNLGQAQQAASTLATIFFSPRLLASRFQYLTRPLLGFRQGAPTSARVRKAVAWEYGKLLTGLGAIYGLAQIMGAKVEKDPRSSDFGKIQIGNTRLDPLAGLAQVTTLLGRLTTGQTKGQKGIKPIRGDDVKYGADDAFDVFTRFLRTKFSPVMGAITDLSSGKNVVGEKVTPVQTAKNLLIPLGFRDIQAVMKEQGVAKGLAIELLNLFGWGMQNYSPRESK